MFNTNFFNLTFDDTQSIKRIGRVQPNDDSLLISWSNSGFSFNFIGERIVLSFADYICDAPVYVKVFVDGKAQRFALVGKTPRILIDCEKDTSHSVKVLRISEGEIYLRFIDATVYGKSPHPLSPDPDKKLRIEFLGDSITTGWGVCAIGTQDTFNTFEQDSTKSYAYMTAELLKADIRTEAIGGQGVWRSCGKAEGIQFKSMFDMSVRNALGYDHSTWIPDVMVLNCGTNDEPGETTHEEMQREANILLDKVRAAYPDAKIIWMYGMMNSKFLPTLKNVIQERQRDGDKNVYFLPIEKISREKNEVGAVGHPNVNASIRVSKKLARFIKRIL